MAELRHFVQIVNCIKRKIKMPENALSILKGFTMAK